MKKKLLKPPEKSGELLVLPETGEFLSHVSDKSKVGVCHQPYFFNPGISAKFIFLDDLPYGEKKIIFHDTDKTKIGANVPSFEGFSKTVTLLDDERALYDYPTPEKKVFNDFFSAMEKELDRFLPAGNESVLSNLRTFKEIILENTARPLLKEALAESFMQFYGIQRGYCFLTDLIKGGEFEDFFLKIYKEGEKFRRIFNEALDEYRKEYKFRFKHFPFPALEEGELPFWIIKDGKRERCFESSIKPEDLGKVTVFPRGSTLTLFLRLYKLDFFIHGIGGANYVWVVNRVIERFFKREVPLLAVVSGTFLLEGLKEREFSYFFFDPEKIKQLIHRVTGV
ncbi:MAG: hypothetical protein ACE5JK_06280 [Candidatus Omnitrophota bacterium]